MVSSFVALRSQIFDPADSGNLRQESAMDIFLLEFLEKLLMLDYQHSQQFKEGVKDLEIWVHFQKH